MFREPTLEERPARRYVAISETVAMDTLGPAVGRLTGEVLTDPQETADPQRYETELAFLTEN